MKQFGQRLLVAAAALWLSACGAAQGATPASSAETAQPADWSQVEAAANKEGSVTVYALNTIAPDQVTRFQEAWNKTYPRIKVDMTAGLNPPDVVAKITAEQDAKAFTGDVAQLGGTTGRQLDKLGFLNPFLPPAVQESGVKWRIDPIQDEAHRGSMLAGTLSYVPIWVNSNLVKPEDDPKTHMDMTDPKWKGKIIWQPPWTSGFGWNEYFLSKKYYGQDWITKMQAQGAAVSSSSNEEINQVARGEYAVGLAAPGGDLATRLIKAGQPLRAVWPDDFVYGSANGFSMLKGAPHANAAKVFVNWWLSDAGQRLYAELGQFPDRADIPAKEDWMKGSDHPKEFWWPKAAEDAQAEATQKEAASYFKK